MLQGGAGLIAALGVVLVIAFQNLQTVLEDLVVEGLGGENSDAGGFGVIRLLPTLIREHPLITAAVIGIVVLALVVTVVALWLSWRYTRFRVDGTGVFLRTGVIARKERSASHDRVQSVDISLPFIPRLLGLASLVFDVAGGSDSDITISYLRRGQAEVLREEILSSLRAGRQQTPPGPGSGPAAGAPGAGPPTTESAAERVPSAGRVDTAGHASPQTSVQRPTAPTAPLGQRLLSRTAQQFQTHASMTVDDLSSSLTTLLTPYRLSPTTGAEGRLLRVPFHRLLWSALLSTTVLVTAVFMLALLAAIIVIAILATPAALVTTVFAMVPGLFALVGVLKSELGLANFTVAITQDGLRVSHGLASTTNRIIPLDRIQAVKLRQPLLWRGPGWWRAEFTMASEGSGDDDTTQNVLLPVGTRDDVMLMLGLCLPDPRPPQGADARSLVLAGMAGPLSRDAETLAGEHAYRGRPRASMWLDPVTWKRNAHALTGTLTLIRSGRLSRTLELVPHARVQSLRLTQGPLQRALGLSTIALHISPGPIAPHVVHLPSAEASQLFDHHATVTRMAREELDAYQDARTAPPSPPPAPPSPPAPDPSPPAPAERPPHEH
ncbi:PH domain-containing protein [Brevibacterium jeotgali]|uniref:PH domain-containing protein n=1 Tax=Brevibacterium jeotgali TaxID=1262550 RepID=UPI002152916F|nr:PH domain-containing protein [Brevibacterium jeotgali]